jgi:tripartite-type tricarboxylate transporter receptor subunit TctC
MYLTSDGRPPMLATANEGGVMRPLSRMLLPAFVLSFAATDAGAESWPAKPVHAIVPFAAGSSTDIVPRVVFEQLSQQLGQPIVVENRAGAGGTIGAAAVAKSEPDGYTVLVSGSAHTIAPALYPKLGYHPGHDFAAVVPLGISPNVLVVSPAKGYKTVSDLVAAAKARPGALNFSSVGVGSATHMAAERFRSSAGIDAMHIPFKGGAEAMSEVIAGRIDFFLGPPVLVLPHIRDGKLTPLAVNSARRTAALPDVLTTQEAGLKDAEYPIWYGLFLPAKTPRSIVDKLYGETTKALQAATVRERSAALFVDPMTMTPGEFDTYVLKEIELNAALIKAAGIKAD